MLIFNLFFFFFPFFIIFFYKVVEHFLDIEETSSCNFFVFQRFGSHLDEDLKKKMNLLIKNLVFQRLVKLPVIASDCNFIVFQRFGSLLGEDF